MKLAIYAFPLLLAGCATGQSEQKQYEGYIRTSAQVGLAENLCGFKFKQNEYFYMEQAIRVLPEKRQIARTEVLIDRLALVNVITPGAGLVNFCKDMMAYP